MIFKVLSILKDTPRYWEQAEEPLKAKSGDMWRDTDTGIIAVLYIENGTKVWMEI